MKWTKVFITALITLLLVILLNIQFGSIPAPGPFFNPVSGFWQTADSQAQARSERLDLPGLNDTVLVVYDDRLVPHIFANNNHDLYYAQGYVTARDRLWQMDFQTRAAAGRLSEFLGEQALEFDLFQRRTGMVFGAQNKLDYYKEHPDILKPLLSYTDGVNQYIEDLSPRHIPLEYKLMGFKPEPWTPLKSLLMHMNMSATLNGRTDSYQLTNTRELLGQTLVDELFPSTFDWVEPIIPPETEWPFEPIRVTPPSSGKQPVHSPLDLLIPPRNPAIGSNSWAVHGSRTATGKPLLSNDMHLNLTLPAIWYEIQLHSPDANVYGVSLPGLPGVIVGFNEDIAWGFTNSGADVLDIYKIQFRDNSWSEYYHDGKWKPTTYSVESILVKNRPIVVDTVFYTHHGPVPHREKPARIGRNYPAGHAMQWIAHQPSLDMMAFYQLNRASGYEDYYKAMQYFDGPAQNWTYADRHGTIALWHNGKFPVRWEGMGDFISDGTDTAYDWHEFIPHDHKPHSVNPERGFVSSANQHPVDENYPYYLGRSFASFERGARINEVLQAGEQLSYLNMMLLQLDDINIRARKAVPVMSSLIDSTNLEKPELLNSLGDWDFSMDANKTEPTLFHYWWTNFSNRVWADVFDDDRNIPYKRPSSTRLLELMIHEPDARVFDKSTLGSSVKLPQLLAESWNESISHLRNHSDNPDNWNWWKFNNVSVPHIANIPALGKSKIKTSGASVAVNASSSEHGPSWRMVVSLEDEVRGWGVYPGGQSGDPGSENYDAFISAWADGAFFPLHFFRTAEEALESIENGIQTVEVKP